MAEVTKYASGYKILFSGVAWTSPGNATGEADDNVASVTLASMQGAKFLVLNHFGFSLPAGATVTGIQVEIRASSSGPTMIMWLTKDSEDTVGMDKYADLSESLEWVVVSEEDELWGTTWTPAEINASTFGVITDVSTYSSPPGTVRVDAVRVSIYYDYEEPPPSEGGGVIPSVVPERIPARIPPIAL